MESDKFKRALLVFDEENKADPNKVVYQNKTYPKELLYGLRMSKCLDEFRPDSSEALKLAARAQHICRWEIPRKEFPMTKVGYHEWRNCLKKFHAEKAGAILTQVGYESDIIDQVKFLIQKKQLKKNVETQALEDVICLVFIQYYLEDFFTSKSEEKMISILRKTWGKMSSAGHQKALSMDLPDAIKPIIKKALA